jgi:aspartate carbamoyltransferase catalytic subunit
MRRIVTARGGADFLRHRVLANIFYEPSTRTSSSFAAAMQRLGGSVLQINEVRAGTPTCGAWAWGTAGRGAHPLTRRLTRLQ